MSTLTEPPPPVPERPLVVSLIGTFLKPEMLSVYRQLTGLRTFRTVVLTERRTHAAQFPFASVVVMKRANQGREVRPHPASRSPNPSRLRPRGNFLRRFFYKHLLGVWPPPSAVVPSAPGPATPHVLPAPTPPDAYDLLPLLAEHRPALLHVYYGHKALKFLPLLRRWPGPVIVSFHGLDVADVAYPKFSGGAGEALPPVFARAQLVLGRSRSLLERLAALGCPPEKLRLNRAPIPLDDLTPRAFHPPSDGAWRLLQACRLIPKKGLVTAMHAFVVILRVHPGARFLVAGDGPQASDLHDLTGRLGIALSVDFLGWCSPERLRELLDNAHLFLHPSENTPGGDREGVPNALLEAMAIGLPVVATDHGGIPEAVTDGEDGLLVPERNPGALAAAVLRVMSNPSLAQTLSRNAILNTRSNFAAAEQTARMEAYYEEAIGSTGKDKLPTNEHSGRS